MAVETISNHDFTADSLSVLIRCKLMQASQEPCKGARQVHFKGVSAVCGRGELRVRPQSEQRPGAGLSQPGLRLSHNPLLQVPTE